MQTIASTMKLVDTNAEQDVLEILLARSERPGLDHSPISPRLRTLFKQSPLPTGSRFQTRTDPGVMVGADSPNAACAEIGYWRWRFLADCTGLDRLDPSPCRALEVDIAARVIDMRIAAFDAQGKRRQYPKLPQATRAFAQAARAARIGAILYKPAHQSGTGCCIALLSTAAIASPRTRTQTEMLYLCVDRSGARWRSERTAFDVSADRWG